MPDTKAISRDCACWMTGSGGLAWPLRCRGWLAAASDVSNMKAFMPKPKMHCYHTFGVVACWLYQYWDKNGAGSIPKYGEHFGLLWPFYKTHHGICDPWLNCKTVIKFLWQGYISIFGTLAKHLSDPGANFESNIIRELCKLIGKWKVRALSSHAETNEQVEWPHHTLVHMIGKLNKDWKAD